MMAAPNARLGTALSRKNWESRRTNSTTSSIGSARESLFGSFDPENEAIASTQPIDSAMFATAKSSRSNARNNGIYSDSESSEASVEAGRGVGHKVMDDSRNDDTMDSSDAMIGDFKVMYSPPGPARRVSKGKTNQNLRQSAQIRLASMASQKENVDPAPQNKRPTEMASKIRRKTLGEINARAAELYDGSLMTDERPVQAAPAKTTRFNPSRIPSNLAPIYGTNTITQSGESKSFMLPDLPNISQLVSGNNPARRPKPSHPALLQTPRGPMHKTVNNVPLPEDEQAIFLSLQLLQRKVSELEASNCEFQQMVEDLKVSNKILRKEKKELRVQNEELRLENEDFRTGYVSKVHRPEEVSQRQKQQAAALDQVNTKLAQNQKGRQEEDLFSLTPTESIKLRSKAATGTKVDNISDRAAGKRPKRVVIEDDSFVVKGRDTREDVSEGNITYIPTQPASNFLSNLRTEMEAERLEARKCKDELKSALPRKSSMKDLSQRISTEDIAAATRAKYQADKPGPSITFDPDLSQDTDQMSRPLSEAARRHSDPTVTAASNTSRRRRASSSYDENMTSAFIIPDITIAQPASLPNIAPEAQNVIHNTCPHDTRNCTICTRLLANNKGSHNRKTISIPLPTPISAQAIEPSTSNPDPTLRPSQPPHIALAIVLKELTDQHTHLKLALRQKQAEYDGLDPRLGRRRRETVGKEVREAVDRCERVAGLVYRLCDVLEGIKGENSGEGEIGEMELEVEVTVQEMRDVLGVYGRGREDREDEEF